MDNPFAAIESALTSTALAAVSNANLRWAGLTLRGVFDAVYTDSLGISNSSPVFQYESEAADVLAGDSVTLIRSGVSTAYVVREVQPDGNGLTRLVMETA